MQIAEDLGLKVERRPIPVEELATFEEAGACGTAAVISPISRLDDIDEGKSYNFGEKPGPISTKLYETLRGIQYGTIEDKHNWTRVVIDLHQKQNRYILSDRCHTSQVHADEPYHSQGSRSNRILYKNDILCHRT